MIKCKTCLVLGAGASKPFGFPTGRELLCGVVSDLRSRSSPLTETLRELGFKDKLIDAFRENLDLSGQPSIDSFLENRSDFMDLGKSAIAFTLVRYENPGVFRRSSDPNWYEYLFQRLGPDQASVRRSRVAVVTFNYDRSLEYYLRSAFAHSFGLDDGQCANLLETIPIAHAYGQLRRLQERTYGMNPVARVVSDCASCIEIVTESRGITEGLEIANALLSSAEVVCFLGFGYHAVNLERLPMDRIEVAKVFGTAFGLADAERDAVSAQFSKSITLGHETEDALEFLRRYPVLA